MNISNYYWYFSGVLTPKFCDDVIEYAKSQKEVMARTGGYGDRKLKKEEVLDLKRKRNSDLVWLNDTWIYKELHPYVHRANAMAGWNFDWERSESCQFTKYKHNQFPIYLMQGIENCRKSFKKVPKLLKMVPWRHLGASRERP